MTISLDNVTGYCNLLCSCMQCYSPAWSRGGGEYWDDCFSWPSLSLHPKTGPPPTDATRGFEPWPHCLPQPNQQVVTDSNKQVSWRSAQTTPSWPLLQSSFVCLQFLSLCTWSWAKLHGRRSSSKKFIGCVCWHTSLSFVHPSTRRPSFLACRSRLVTTWSR